MITVVLRDLNYKRPYRVNLEILVCSLRLIAADATARQAMGV